MLTRNPMVTGDRLLLDIGYKSNSQDVLYIFTTEGEEITKIGIPCLSRYPE